MHSHNSYYLYVSAKNKKGLAKVLCLKGLFNQTNETWSQSKIVVLQTYSLFFTRMKKTLTRDVLALSLVYYEMLAISMFDIPFQRIIYKQNNVIYSKLPNFVWYFFLVASSMTTVAIIFPSSSADVFWTVVSW